MKNKNIIKKLIKMINRRIQKNNNNVKNTNNIRRQIEQLEKQIIILKGTQQCGNRDMIRIRMRKWRIEDKLNKSKI